MSTVHYKFKSSLEYQSVTFDGIHISLGDLKRGISHQKRLKPGEYNLVITNAQTREVYKNDDELIPKNSSVIVSRIPVAATTTTNSTSKAWEQFKQDCAKAVANSAMSPQSNSNVLQSAKLSDNKSIC